MPSLNLLQKNLLARSKDIGDICERNIYSIQFLLTVADLKKANSKAVEVQEEDSSDDDLQSDEDSQEVSDMDFVTNWASWCEKKNNLFF